MISMRYVPGEAGQPAARGQQPAGRGERTPGIGEDDRGDDGAEAEAGQRGTHVHDHGTWRGRGAQQVVEGPCPPRGRYLVRLGNLPTGKHP
jgi:hypothetical protein